MMRWPPLNRKPKVAVVRLAGVISGVGRGALSDQALAPVLKRAFRRGTFKAVALQMNSPGGSPVQSALIGARLRELADQHSMPLFAFVEDVAASGGYWIACCADQIYADANSVIGSIGVISAGFGAHEFLARHGFERRVHTAGASKSMLDPFRPEKAEDVARLRDLLEQTHQNFITHVQARRQGKLAADTALFTGDVWLGRRAQQLGLIDGLGHLVPTMQERFGAHVQFRYFGLQRPLWRRLGAAFANDILDVAEERASFARFGL
ncbi:MAG: S49 family peptidase [Rhodobacteraceae bacterium]|nr:S49 family peptidase [Paracoccaceae bacterium]